jgi:hypothetical protein
MKLTLETKIVLHPTFDADSVEFVEYDFRFSNGKSSHGMKKLLEKSSVADHEKRMIEDMFYEFKHVVMGEL